MTMRHDEALQQYLDFCEKQKELDAKTLKAYRIDLKQFLSFLACRKEQISRESISEYIVYLNERYMVRSVKRKIASIKAFCSYLYEEGLLDRNLGHELRVKLPQVRNLPRTIPLRVIEAMLSAVYGQMHLPASDVARRTAIREAAVMELLFATGIRVSELCGLKKGDIDLTDGVARIHGKGRKERVVQIENEQVLDVLKMYRTEEIESDSECFFLNRRGTGLTDQSVRLILNKYADQIGSPIHVTPHMFRHSFATLMLEADVDIRYIQQLLGHSSISTTQIYTYVSTAKLRDILATKHPRNSISLR